MKSLKFQKKKKVCLHKALIIIRKKTKTRMFTLMMTRKKTKAPMFTLMVSGKKIKAQRSSVKLYICERDEDDISFIERIGKIFRPFTQ